MIWSPEIFNKALQFATLAHHGQVYKGCHPDVEYDYISHPAAVAMRVIHALPATPECDANLAIQCALLHDVIEDTEVSYEEVADMFGLNVAAGVQALSKNPFLEKKDQMLDSLMRIREQPQEIWMVKLADRIDNLECVPPHWGVTKAENYCKEAQLILRQLGEANSQLAKQLQQRIDNYGL